MYLVSNGVTGTKEISDEEAREAYVRTDPRLRHGTYEKGFDTFAASEFGRVLTCAATAYRPIRKDE